MIDVNGIVTDTIGNVYCLSNYWSAVNVYSSIGTFLYSLSVPEYQNGTCEIFVKDDILFIVDKEGTVYFYSSGDFLGKLGNDSENNKISVYNKNDELVYSISYTGDEYKCDPLYIEGEDLYVLNTNNYLMLYKNGILVSEEPNNDSTLEITYAGNNTTDSEGNIYCITGLIPELIKISPEKSTIVIASDPFFEWIPHQSYACLLICMFGLIISILCGSSNKKKKIYCSKNNIILSCTRILILK